MSIGIWQLVIVAISGLPIYFLPWIIGVLRRHPRRGALFILNLLVGWTGIGWLALSAWAILEKPRPEPVPV